MKALVFGGPGQASWDTVPDPQPIDATDAVVEIAPTTICGTDLHILKGDVPAVIEGRVLGHEGVGTVVAAGPAVRNVAVGDRVIVSCISACGVCSYCRSGNPSHCLADEGASGIGWILGHLIDGTQAEYVRVPFADNSLYKVPAGVPDDQAVLLSDIFPTGFEIGVEYGQVKPGDTVVVVGAGPVGLAAIATAGLHGSAQVVAVDPDENRREVARRVGATHVLDPADNDIRKAVLALSDGLGADVAIEAVGIPATFQTCLDVVRPGGHVANVGVHGSAVELDLQSLWIQNIVISTGLVNTTSLPMLLRLIASGKLPAEELVTHRFDMTEILNAYDTFGRAAETRALKVLMQR